MDENHDDLPSEGKTAMAVPATSLVAVELSPADALPNAQIHTTLNAETV